ncbi:MAG: hypothetical protein D6757_03155 [Alphaproteobacteria bacterium]|nr:MAG: hypothetical protein D6757_03155 [Alphaproteobacteria bacterium]
MQSQALRKGWRAFAGCLLGLAAIGLLASAPSTARADTQKVKVEVTYGQPLADKVAAIDAIEQMLEQRFRNNRYYARSYREAGILRNTRTRFAKVKWANELLIPDVKDYTLNHLIAAVTRYELDRALPDFEGTVRYHIKALKVDNHDVALLRGASSYVIGSVEVRDAKGNLVGKADDISANLVVDYTVDNSYSGPKLAFAETDEHNRVGPTVAWSVKKALSKVWPEHKKDFVGPIIVRISGPNEDIAYPNN